MKAILRFLGPVGTFCFGMVGTLLMTIFFPQIQTAADAIPSATRDISQYPYFSAMITSTRLIIFFGCLAGTLFATFMSWWYQDQQ